ncbi:SRPBCC family protein [Tsukamurella tyrosinosolvens]|uniref:SRPBCC family protein n=1 Tax=Tsukamurella tyrosinosolvens TaxID=57704 RepID=UPI000799EB52|nr:SRPBCC family protein [Tsukamurella tyrosinosolvens]KXP04776.1 hypothetical protein AXK59_15470 [Tsukamurella tyrosinosolvens]KZL98030.1 hypothetical protein AXX05_03665 [Tsukamurella tyrosinosolvens]MCA4995324.1 SRPBCC family protein [Tsukamurella tyrosinosolvens]
MRITSTVTVAAPRTAVFAAFADIENAPARMSGIESVDFVSDVRTGLGTRWRETRRMYGRAATEEMEITAFDAPSGYTVEADGPGVRYRTEFRFEDDGAGTRVTMTFGGEPTTTVSRILAVLTKPLTGSVRKAVEADLADMKRYLERPGS